IPSRIVPAQPRAWPFLAAVFIAGSVANAVPPTAGGTPPLKAPLAGALAAGGTARPTAIRRRAACPAGHLRLGLAGPSRVAPQQPTTYTFVTRPCGKRRVRTL